MYSKRIVVAVLLALLLTGGLLWATVPATAQNTDCYMMQGGNKFVCDNGGEIELQTGAVLDLQAGTTVNLAASLTQSDGNLIVADFQRIAPQTGITLTMAGELTPTGTYQPISAAGAIGLSRVDTQTVSAGTILLLVNTTNVTITFTDTAPLKLAGNAALTQDDTLLLLFDGTSWVQVGKEAN